MSEGNPELSSTELLRQAREALGVPKPGSWVSTKVDGPTIQDLLATPLTSESLLPQRAVDYWDEDADDATAEPWEQIDHRASARANATDPLIRKRAYVPHSDDETPSLMPGPFPDAAPPPVPPGPVAVPRPTTRSRRPVAVPARSAQRAKVPWRLLVFGFIAVSVLFNALADRGLTSADPVELGACYDSSEFANADTVNCGLPHRVQVFALIEATVIDGDSVDQCFDEAVALSDSGSMADTAIVPDGTFVGATDAPSTADGNTFCYFESPIRGLIGSVLPE